MSKIGRLPELPALTGLRFFAAFSILLNHLLLGFISRDNPWLSNLLTAGGSLGMSIFFILSGFIIHYNYHVKLKNFTSHSLFEFFVARFSRLYPLFVFLFLVDFFATNLTIQRFNPDDVWRSLKYFLTISQSWFYLPTTTGETIAYMFPRASITWSISTEMLMYCCYPLVLLAFKYDRSRTLSRVLYVCAIVLTISVGMRYLNNHMSDFDPLGVSMFGEQAGMQRNVSYSFAFWFVLCSPYVRVFEFIIGAITAHLFLSLQTQPVKSLEKRIVPKIGLFSLLFIIFTFLQNSYATNWIKYVLDLIGYGPSIAIIIFVSARYSTSMVCRILSISVFVNLGERSYSIYLFHIFLYHAAAHLASAGWLEKGVQIVVLWITVFASAHILYRFIEIPAQRKIREILMAAYPSVAIGWRKMFAAA